MAEFVTQDSGGGFITSYGTVQGREGVPLSVILVDLEEIRIKNRAFDNEEDLFQDADHDLDVLYITQEDTPVDEIKGFLEQHLTPVAAFAVVEQYKEIRAKKSPVLAKVFEALLDAFPGRTERDLLKFPALIADDIKDGRAPEEVANSLNVDASWDKETVLRVIDGMIERGVFPGAEKGCCENMEFYEV